MFCFHDDTDAMFCWRIFHDWRIFTTTRTCFVDLFSRRCRSVLFDAISRRRRRNVLMTHFHDWRIFTTTRTTWWRASATEGRSGSGRRGSCNRFKKNLFSKNPYFEWNIIYKSTFSSFLERHSIQCLCPQLQDTFLAWNYTINFRPPIRSWICREFFCRDFFVRNCDSWDPHLAKTTTSRLVLYNCWMPSMVRAVGRLCRERSVSYSHR
jgi:hypothetical protein